MSRTSDRTRLRAAVAGLLLLLTVLVLAVGAAAGRAAPAAATVGPNVRLNSATTDQQQEPTLAIDPANPRIILAAAKDWRSGQKEVWNYRSTDGGATWADSHLPGLPANLPNQSDPIVLFDATGVAYTAIIGYNQADFSLGGLFVARSTDGGATWGRPVQAAQNSDRIFNDKPWLTVDRSPTGTRGTLYLTWTRFTTISAQQERADIVEVSSTDGGATWSATVQVSRASDQTNVQGSYPAVGPDGALHVLYFDNTATPALWVAASADRGATFAAPARVADVHLPPSPLPTSKFRIFVLPVLAIDPTDGALAATWNDYPGNSDVLLTASHDGGGTWGTPVRVNEDTTTTDQFFPTATFGPDGRLHVAWLDRRDDPHNLTFSCYYAQSSDDGATFSANVRLATAQSDPSIGFQGTLIGDYIAADATAGRAWVAWVDTRGGTQDIYGAAITGTVPAPPTAAPTPLPTTPAATPATTPGATPSATPTGGSTFVDPAFARVWARADLPVQQGVAARPWLWGPAPFAAGNEAYLQGVNGHRLVQYFDKARMEINDPTADPNSPWYVTNGLLVVEMMTGRVQIGNTEYEAQTYAPNAVPVAGDINSPDAPSYAALAHLASLHGDNHQDDRTGQVVDGIVDATGSLTPGTPPIAAAAQVHDAHYDVALGHNIPDIFWAFMQQQGPIAVNGQIQQGQVVDPLFDFGHPITEAYWARLRIAGQDHWALIQAFQRRVLTYVPDNAPPWQVEMANVGRQYYDWRYGAQSPLATLRGDMDEDR